MKYISLDIETLGLIPGEHSVIQIGAICEDTENILPFEECPKYDVLIKHPIYHGTPFAMSMHPKLLLELEPNGQIVPTRRVVSVNDIGEDFKFWLLEGANYFPKKKFGPINIAGKNAGTFDIQHLNKIPNWKETIITKHKILDPAIVFWEPLKDKDLPGLQKCKERAGIIDTTVAHTALEDAWDVILLLRKLYTK